MFKFIERVYNEWQERKFLKEHGCDNRAQYNYRNDPCVSTGADNLQDYYCGYPAAVHVRYAVVSNLMSWQDPLGAPPYELTNWCDEHCKDEFRLDYIRGSFINSKFVIAKMTMYTSSAFDTSEYFMAFKSEKDALMFKMRWI